MRVMIWADMEGVCGIQTWAQVGEPIGPAYEEGRRLYTGEVNAAVRGARRAGADEVIVVDGHGGGYRFQSLLPDQLEPGARYVNGFTWARYVEPLREGCDAILFVGAHAMAGTADGVLCHTVSSEAWYNASINGTLVGESGIVAAICGSFGVPAVFVAGDEATCREVQTLLGPECTAVAVKRGLARFAALNRAAREACELIEEGVERALSGGNWPRPLTFTPPVTFRVELASPEHVAFYRGRAGVQITGPRTVEASGGSFWEAWDQFWYRGA
jgi:D-amino peptidase